MNYQSLRKSSLYSRREIKPNLDHSFESRRSQKIYEKHMIYESGLDNVSLTGRGELSLSNDNNLHHENTLLLKTNTAIENVSPRPSSKISFSLNHLNLDKYNYLGAYVYVKSRGYNGFYFHFMTGNEGHLTNHAPIIYPNTWQYVVWDAKHIVRSDINIFSITPYLMGCPPEADPDIEIYVDSIFAFVGDEVYDLGWDLESRIAYCHSGYLPNAKKEALIHKTDSTSFKVIGNKTYELKIKETSSSLGNYSLLDFSEITEEGIYHIEVDNIHSEDFVISNHCFENSILKSLNFLRSLRCGEHIEGVHTKCHLNCRSQHTDGRSVPNFGGWHDAGDVSQFEIPTAEITASLLDLSYVYSSEMNDRILEESKIGLDWLYQTRFKDGYRALAVTYSIWRDNVLDPENKTIYTNPAERGAFENILSSIAFAKGAKAFARKNETYSGFLKKLAIEDFDFAVYEYDNNIYTKRWGNTICSQTLGSLLLGASLLFELTKDYKYYSFIEQRVTTLIDTQESSLSHPLPGFFYEDTLHKYTLMYEHRAHEEYPVLGLISSYNVLKEKKLKDVILSSLHLYASYIKESIKYTNPYNLLPGYVYHKDKINLEHLTVPSNLSKEEALDFLGKQIDEGISLGDGFYLRIMPISFTRRGFLATLLSKNKAVSSLSNFLKDDELKCIALRQIEWTLGLNPFSSSLMYGEGYNYHNLYVAFSKQIVGALPVGIMTRDNYDAPYWPDYTNAVFKEIWGHTSGKYLSCLADILKR